MSAAAGFSARMGSFAPGWGAAGTARPGLAGAPTASAPAGFPVAAGRAMGASGGCPSRAVCCGTAGSPTAIASSGAAFPAALGVCRFGWFPTSAVTPSPGNPGSTSSSTAGIFPDEPGTCPSAASLAGGDWDELAHAGFPSGPGMEMDSTGTEKFRPAATMARVGCIWIAEMLALAASCPGSGSGSLAPAASLGAVSDGCGKLARRAAGARLAAGTGAPAAGTADSPGGADRIPFSHVSMPAGVPRPGATSDDLGASPAAAPVPATRPASNSGNMPSPAAVASAHGLWSAMSRVEAPGVAPRTL
jgi:hypothetical protein